MMRPLAPLIAGLLLVAIGPPAHAAAPATPPPAAAAATPAGATPTVAAKAPAAVAAAPAESPVIAASAPAAAPPQAEAPPTTPAEADSSTGDSEKESDAAPLTPPDPQIKADLEQRLKSLDAAGLSDDDKVAAREFYQQAIESFDVAAGQVESALKFGEQLAIVKQGTKSTTETTAKLARPLPPYEDVSGEPLAEVEARAVRLEKNLDVYRQELDQMEGEPKRRAGRMADLPQQIADAQQKLKQSAEQLAALNSEDATNIVAGARRAALTQNVAALEATLLAFDAEQRLYRQSADWVKVRRDYFARYVPHKAKRLAMLRQLINERREDLAQQQAREAAQAASEIRPATIRQPAQEVLADLANENKRLAEELPTVAAKLTAVSHQFDQSRKILRDLQARYQRVQEQVSANELSEFNGLMLRQQQAELPDMRELMRRKARRDEEHADVLAKTLEFYDADAELANLDDVTEQTTARAGDLSDEVRGEVRKLFEARRDILASLLTSYEKYSLQLSTLDVDESQLLTTAREYATFIAKRVLWIRSCAPFRREDWRAAGAAAAWSLDPRNWRDAASALLASAQRHPAQLALFTIALVGLAGFQRPARRRLAELGEEAQKRGCTKLAPTFQALWLTILIALPWPAGLALLGWSLDSLSESDFVRSLSLAIRFAAGCLLLLGVVRQICRSGGLADAHFNWPQNCLSHLRRRLYWLTVLGLPLVWWLVGLEVQTIDPKWSASLGRTAFILVMLLMAGVFHRILLSAASPYRQVILYSERGWLKPLQLAWRPAIVLLPLALAVMAALGYYYTAQQAALRLLGTVAMLLAVLTLGGFTRRWLLVNRRRLAREQAKQRRAQLAALADADPATPPAGEVVEEIVDLAALSEQTQKLVRTFLAITTTVGLVLIWAEILPALAYPAGHLLPGAAVLTWGDLGMFLLVLLVTYVSVRDIPALLELVILQHLPLDSGARYAVTSLCRYVLTAIGLTAAFNALGGEWSKVQWLVAAMSVGLGFGLQEIFANFVAGIILLFERPIRVGDIVTLGDRSGVVNRIRMRATTIVDWDRKEYIVPNKDLVTERLLNWTLSDQMNRIEIILIVAHGTETDRACSLLLESAREQPHILGEPSPSAAFEGFTEGGLKLALRCFLPTLEHRGTTIHGLHSTIDRKLRASGIEIASPPREMRVRFLRDHPAHAVAAPHAAFSPKADSKSGKHSAA